MRNPPDLELDVGVCYFGDAAYLIGQFVCRSSELLCREAHGCRSAKAGFVPANIGVRVPIQSGRMMQIGGAETRRSRHRCAGKVRLSFESLRTWEPSME